MRVAILSLRDVRPVPWYGGIVDAEDALATAFDAPVHRVRTSSAVYTGPVLSSWHVRRVLGTTRVARPYRIEPEPTGPADVLLVVVNDLHDASVLLSLPGWHALGETVLIHMSEVNDRDLRIYPEVAAHLRRHADHVFLALPGPWQRAVAGRRQRRATAVPMLVDVLAFPRADRAVRPIDVLNLGRRHPDQHALLSKWAGEDRFYLVDTGYLGRVHSLVEHRSQYRRLATRSTVFVTNYAAVSGGSRGFPRPEIGARFYEALAAGCVLTGDLPTGAERMAEIMGAEPVRWPVDAPVVPPEFIEVMADPVEVLRRRTAALAIANSVVDVAHRWQEMAAEAGLPEHRGLRARLNRLRDAGSVPSVAR